MDKRIEDFLDHASEGLRDDIELRLDTRAELATHAEEKLQELEHDGIAHDEAVQQAVKSLGEPIELATDLYKANRKRMTLRAQLRIFMRFALVPVAIITTIWNLEISPSCSLWRLLQGGPASQQIATMLYNLSDQDCFILDGDLSLENSVDQQKSIWESDPTNRIYFANYFHEVGRSNDFYSSEIPTDLLETARQIDPDNAYYVYLEALQELTNTIHTTWPNDFGESITPADTPFYEIINRERLDHCMALIEQALNMSHYSCYSTEMTRIRLSLLPPPRYLIDLMVRLGVVIDSSHSPIIKREALQLTKSMVAYGDLLLKEGDFKRAEQFLNGWEILTRQLSSNSDSLVEVRIACGLPDFGCDSAAVYRAADRNTTADRMAARADVAYIRSKLIQKMKGSNSDVIQEHGGILAFMSTPNNILPTHAGILAPSRRLELTMVTRFAIGIISALLFLAIVGCVLASLRWRFSKKGRVIPILLIPSGHSLMNTLAYSVILPGMIFLIFTRLVPASGHEYSFSAGAHKLIAEFELLAIALLTLPALLGTRAVRRRCEELNIPTAPFAARRLLPILMGESFVLILLWLTPAPPIHLVKLGTFIVAGLTGLTLLASAITGFVQGMGGQKKYGLFYGTVFRSRIPLLAGAMLLINLVSRPILQNAEEKYVRQDTLLNLTQSPHMSRLKTETINYIRTELQAALKELDSMP